MAVIDVCQEKDYPYLAFSMSWTLNFNTITVNTNTQYSQLAINFNRLFRAQCLICL